MLTRAGLAGLRRGDCGTAELTEAYVGELDRFADPIGHKASLQV